MTGPEDRAIILAIERLEALLCEVVMLQRELIHYDHLILDILKPKPYPKSTGATVKVTS